MPFRLRRGTAAQWTAADPVLAQGEPGYETDTGTFKIGDGSTAWASLPEHADSVALDATYASVAAARPGNRMVWLGDSLTQWQDAAAAVNAPTSTTSHNQRVSLGNLGSIISNQQALYVTNAGVGGDTTAQMVARFDTDVTPHAPNVVHILGGTNDSSGNLAGTLANLTTLVEKTRAIGAVPILGLIPPADATTKSEQTNAGIARLAAALGVTVIDYCEPLIDTADGTLAAAYDRDGTHPTDAGFVLMAQTFATAFAKVAPAWGPPLPQRNTMTNNLLANGLFLTSGATGSGRASWTGGTGTGITSSSESGASDGILGNWLTIDAVASGSAAQVYQNVVTAPVPGNRYALMGRLKSTWTSGNGIQIRNRITLDDASTVDMMPLNNMGVSLTAPGTFYTEYTCPADAASHQVSLFVNAGTAKLWVGQIGLYDLTAMGVV